MRLARPGTAATAAALAIASALSAASPAGASDLFVEAFRAGCLAHIPDFSGSPAAFEKLGFTRSDGRFLRDSEGSDMLAEVYERTVDAGAGCVLAFEAGREMDVLPEVEAMVANLSGNDFSRRDAERGGRRVEAFSWNADGWEVLVVVLPRMSGMQALNVTVAEAR